MLGAVTPYLFYSTWLFWNDQFIWFWVCKWQQLHQFAIPEVAEVNWFLIALYGGTFVLSMISVFGVLSSLVDRGIKQRKAYGLVLGFVSISVLTAFIGELAFYQHMLLLSVPAIFLISDFFIQKRKKWLSESLFVLYLVLIAINLI